MDEFDRVVLTWSELRDLRKVRKEKLHFRRADPRDALLNNGLLIVSRGKDRPDIMAVRISDKGTRYLIYRRRHLMRKWLPIWISLVALFRPEITAGMKLLMQLLR